MELIRRDQALVGAIFAVILVTFVLVVFTPQRRRLRELRRERQETTEALTRDKAKAKELASLRGEVKQMTDRLRFFNQRLPDQQELGQFLRDVSNSARSAGLGVATFEPEETREGELYAQMPIAMKFKGNFMELARFLRQAKEMTRLTHVGRLRVDNDKTLSGQCDVDMVMTIYFTRN